MVCEYQRNQDLKSLQGSTYNACLYFGLDLCRHLVFSNLGIVTDCFVVDAMRAS